MIIKSTTTKSLSNIHTLYVALVVCALLAASGCRRGDELGPVADAQAFVSIRTTFSQGSEGVGRETAAPTGTGWATLKGRFIFEGTVPQMQPYNVNRDQATCNINGRPPLQETILVDDATMIRLCRLILLSFTRLTARTSPRESIPCSSGVDRFQLKRVSAPSKLPPSAVETDVWGRSFSMTADDNHHRSGLSLENVGWAYACATLA